MAPLVDVFLASLVHPPATTTDRAALAALLQETIDAARSAWPDVAVDPEEFTRYLAERVPSGPSCEESLRALHVSDLYLACACARGDAAAVRALEQTVLPKVDDALARVTRDEDARNEARQSLWTRLLVSDGDSPGRIRTYGGRGDLVGWLRVAAVRELMMRARAGNRRKAQEGAAEKRERLSEIDALDPELLHFKRRYREDFERAFRDGARALSSEERTLLRQHYIDEIGAVFGVHRVTAARRVNRAREALVRETRRILGERLGLDEKRLESVLMLIRSGVEVSIRGALEESPKRD